GCDKAMHARLRGVPRRRRAITDAQASDTPRALEVSRARFKSAQALILSSPGRPPYRMFYYGAGFARGAQRRNRALMADLRFRGQADMGDRLVSTSWVAIDPKRTKTGLKSRSAAVFCRIVCRRRLDSEQFRSAPRTLCPLCGRLSTR